MEPHELRAAEIFRHLARTQAPASSATLAQQLGVSPRTIKSAMPTVRRFARERGARVASSRGVGHWLEIDDAASVEAAILQLDVQLAGSPDQRWSRAWQTTQLLPWILGRPGDFTLGELASASYRSASALRTSLPSIRSYLEGYGLRLVAHGASGFGVEGPELNRRWCLVSLLASPYHHAENLYRSFPTQTLPVDPDTFTAIRHALLDVLREHSFRLMDEHSQLVAQYLYVAARRRGAGGPSPRAHTGTDPQLETFAAHHVAAVVLDRVAALGQPGADLLRDDPTAEQDALATLLVLHEDAAAPPAGSWPAARADALADIVAERLDAIGGLHWWRAPQRRPDLVSALVPIALRERLGWLQMGPSNAVLHHDRLGTSPLGEGLARHAAAALSGAGLTLGEPAVSALASRLAAQVCTVAMPFTPRRVAVCTTSGLTGAQVIRSRLLRGFPTGTFASIEVAELYELRTRAPDDLDAVVLDYPEFSFRYHWPHARLRQGWPAAAHGPLLRRVIHPGLRIAERVEAAGLVLRVFAGFNAGTRAEIAAGLALRFGSSPDEVAALQPFILDSLTGRVLGHTLVVVMDPRGATRRAVELFALASPLTDKLGLEVSHVLCLSIDYAGDTALLRIMEELAHRLCFDASAAAAFAADPSPATVAALTAPGLFGDMTIVDQSCDHSSQASPS